MRLCSSATSAVSRRTENYSRLFPATSTPFSRRDEDRLIALAESLRYSGRPRDGILTPRAGFTYLGQFIGHDLTHDCTPLHAARPNTAQLQDARASKLDLEVLYGGGPEQDPELYCGDAGAETFRIGSTAARVFRDLPFKDGRPLLADERNLDNLILRQLHVVWLKFHNEAIRQIADRELRLDQTERDSDSSVFDRAQRLVRRHYRWIIRHDFLPRVLHNTFWTCKPGMGFGTSSSVPVEFSLAAYRFGHSMVRPAYGLSCRKPRVEITELMERGPACEPIPDDYLLEWGRFFDGLPRSAPVGSSSYIDTSLVGPLHELPEKVVRLGKNGESPGQPVSLPARTMLRGARTWLASGQEVVESLSRNGFLAEPRFRLTAEDLVTDTVNHAGTALRETGLQKNTPLFYYLLKEAEMIGHGRTLGPIGSQIVGSVILNLLSRGDGASNYAAHAQLPLWRFPDGACRKVDSMKAIIRLVGDTVLFPECETKWRRFGLSIKTAAE